MTSIHEPMASLVRQLVRMFYDKHHVVIMDIMLAHMILSEEDIADKMKMLPREFNRLAIRLRDDKLLCTETVSDLKEDGKQITTTKFFLDFRVIRNAIKYKIYTMTQRLEKKLRDTESTLGFGCEHCHTIYSVLDAQSFLSLDDYTFRCPECKEPLQEKKEESREEKETISTVFTSLMEEIAPIITQLKEIDKLGVPEMSRGKIILSQSQLEKKQEVAPEKEEEQEQISEEDSEPATTQDHIVLALEQTKEKTLTSPNSQHIEENLTVKGIPKMFSEITEDDQDLMTESEYEKYFEVYEKYNTTK